MATGPSAYFCAAALNAAFNNTAFQVTAAYIQLHTGDPGAAGTANVAGNGTRKAMTMGTATSAITSDADIEWTSVEVDTSEDYSHWTSWDASTSGNFLGSGLMTANAVATADEFRIPAGDLDIAMTPAS